MSDDRRWAAEQAGRLVEQARAEALEEARARLRARYVEVLLRTAEQLGRPVAPPPADDADAVWVYGVCDASAPDLGSVTGVDGHPVELVRHAGLAALASHVPLAEFGEAPLREALEDIGRVEELARGHEGVLDAALGNGPLVPFRMCTMYADAERVRAMLATEHDRLAATLDRLRGSAEWGVKAFLHPRREPVGAGPTSGAEYLSRKRESREAAAASRDAIDDAVAAIHARLAEQAAGAVLSRPQDRRLSGRDEAMILNGAYLVPDDRLDGFRALVDELSGRHEPEGIELQLTGPWPAFHFAEQEQVG
jgi:Gas vesicle synthesis protein GvpL/GvpF